MDHITTRINIVINIVKDYFFKNDITNSCLAQSYILYRYIDDLTSESTIHPTIIKGYVVDHNNKEYHGHFWVEYNGNIYDIGTETLLLRVPIEQRNKIRQDRILIKNIPDEIIENYKRGDTMDNFEEIRKRSYDMCMKKNFFEDLINNNCPIEHYNKLKNIHDSVIRNKKSKNS